MDDIITVMRKGELTVATFANFAKACNTIENWNNYMWILGFRKGQYMDVYYEVSNRRGYGIVGVVGKNIKN